MYYEHKLIESFDQTKIRLVLKENGHKEWLIVTHGLGEHSGRHEYFFKIFSQNFNIVLYDLRGHGKSGGKPGYVESFQHYSLDLRAIIEFLKSSYSMTRYSLFGHSMGGLITASFLQNEAKKDLYPSKVFLSSPAVAAPQLMGYFFSNAPKMFYSLATRLPSLPISGILDLKKLSHDQRVYESYIADELNHLKIHTKLFMELLKTSRDVFSRPLRADCPLYCSIGSEDALVNADLVVDYFTKVEKNAQLRVFQGAYHEIHNEVERFKNDYFIFLRESLTGITL